MRLALPRLKRRDDPVFVLAFYGIASLYALLILVPLYFLLVSSFKDNSQIYLQPLALPRSFSLDWYAAALTRGSLLRAIGYSLLITVSAEILTLGLAFPAAYAIARIRIPLATAFETAFGAGFLIPAFAMLVPIFLIMSRLGLTYNPLSVIIFYPATHMALSVTLLASYLRIIPRELEESAEIDGATRLEMIVHLFFPLAKPGVATVLVLNFIHIWHEFLFALILLNTQTRTVQVAITTLKGEHVSEYGIIAAGVIIVSLPVLVVFVLFQERIMAGMTAGAVKG